MYRIILSSLQYAHFHRHTFKPLGYSLALNYTFENSSAKFRKKQICCLARKAILLGFFFFFSIPFTTKFLDLMVS